MSKSHVVILGGGPAGLGAAWQLRKQGKAEVTVLEKNDIVGGNAGSFDFGGMRVDFGSHRLHPACHEDVLNDIRDLLGSDLLDRPRHGRIRLQGKWIHFPLKPQDLALLLPLNFSFGVGKDAVTKLFKKRSNGGSPETFASVLRDGLGRTICNDFYFPYAEKIWGRPPEDLSAIQARRRVSAGSLTKLVGKVLSIVPGFKQPGAGRFYYPRHGFGQISERFAKAAVREGADLRTGCSVTGLEFHADKHLVEFLNNGEAVSLEADHVWSTIPVSLLAQFNAPQTPEDVLNASRNISYRAMILIYVALDTPQWTEFDAHYFPEKRIRLTRLSEPKNYSASTMPEGRTVLCGELPCSIDDDVWKYSDEDLGEVVVESLANSGLELDATVLEVGSRRLPFAYPIYVDGYEEHFGKIDDWAEGLERVLTFGRQGLFAHDNTHHALAMAYGAVDCLGNNGVFDRDRWAEYREEFAKHVVED